jgi:hypothetical protein
MYKMNGDETNSSMVVSYVFRCPENRLILFHDDETTSIHFTINMVLCHTKT